MHTILQGSVLLFVVVASCVATFEQEIEDGVSADEPGMATVEEDPFGIPPGTLDIEGNVIDRRRIIQTIRVSNGAPWGKWGKASFCNGRSYAAGYDMKIQSEQNSGDDTALNGIKIICKDKADNVRHVSSSSVFRYGQWVGRTFCNVTDGVPDFMTAFKLQVEKRQGILKDDTAANYVEFKCRGLDKSYRQQYTLVMYPGHGMWGKWGSWSASCPEGSAICGIKTKVSVYKWYKVLYDYTGLNDAIFYCCK